MPRTLMLKGLAPGTGVRSVFETCRQYGHISQIVVENAGVWDEPATVAFVEFSRKQDADIARCSLGDQTIGNTRIVVE
jgi:hypothetical protein